MYCRTCKKTFGTTSSLYRHREEAHGIQQYRCPLCSYVSEDARHVREQHGPEQHGRELTVREVRRRPHQELQKPASPRIVRDSSLGRSPKVSVEPMESAPLRSPPSKRLRAEEKPDSKHPRIHQKPPPVPRRVDPSSSKMSPPPPSSSSSNRRATATVSVPPERRPDTPGRDLFPHSPVRLNPARRLEVGSPAPPPRTLRL